MAINNFDQRARPRSIRDRLRAITLGTGAAVILGLAVFGGVTIVTDFASNVDTASAASSAGGPGGAEAIMAAQQQPNPNMDEMVRLCTEHMQSMSSMMQMMDGMGGMMGGAGSSR